MKKSFLLGILVAAIPGILQGQQPLPRHLSLRELEMEPRAQGERDTCSLFAITAVAEMESGRHTPQARHRLSQEFLIWAGNEASGLKGDQAMFYKAAHGLNTFGICTEELMPYARQSDPKRRPSARALADAKERSRRWKVEWIRRWDITQPLSQAQFLAMKHALAKGHPLACGFRWPKELQGHEILNVPGPGKVSDGHSVVLDGYDDDPAKEGGGAFLFRNSWGPKWGDKGHGTMCYAYARAYLNDALWLQFEPPHSEVPAQRFEAETMRVLAREKCTVNPQKMHEFGAGMWSNGAQLFCEAHPGGFVGLAFTVHKAGDYRLRVLATAAPDFGRIKLALDGKPLPPQFDLYCGRVSPAGSLELGTHHFTAGVHRLRFTAVGKNSASTNFFFGLDAVDLIAVK